MADLRPAAADTTGCAALVLRAILRWCWRVGLAHAGPARQPRFTGAMAPISI
jgi:hypothetical protein